MEFRDAVAVLVSGGFSRLAPLFRGKRPQIVAWVEKGLFEDQPQALAEALACACFLGRTEVAEFLLQRGVDPAAGNGTGLDAFHWAVNRGQLAVVRLLLRHNASLETRSMYGGTVLGTAIWSARNEPRRDHLEIIEELLSAGADLGAGAPVRNETEKSGR